VGPICWFFTKFYFKTGGGKLFFDYFWLWNFLGAAFFCFAPTPPQKGLFKSGGGPFISGLTVQRGGLFKGGGFIFFFFFWVFWNFFFFFFPPPGFFFRVFQKVPGGKRKVQVVRKFFFPVYITLFGGEKRGGNPQKFFPKKPPFKKNSLFPPRKKTEKGFPRSSFFRFLKLF